MTRAQAMTYRAIIEKAVGSLEDDYAAEAPELFPRWAAAHAYVAGDRVCYGEFLYKVLQPHTSQIGWEPDVAVSLFAKVLIPDPSEIPEWEQPGSTNPYMKGDKVRHNEKVWVSLVDNNVWEPGAVGTETLWAELTE